MTGGKLNLRKGYRETIAAAVEEGARYGAEVYFDLVGKHPSLIVKQGGRTARASFASTPRRDNHANYGRVAVRRALRKLESVQ